MDVEHFAIEELFPHYVLIPIEKYNLSNKYSIASRNMLVWLEKNIDARNRYEKSWMHRRVILSNSNYRFEHYIGFYFKYKEDCALFSFTFL